MTEIHKSVCDRCGISKDMIYQLYDRHKLPSGWTNVAVNWFTDKDICPKCRKEIKGEVAKLFNKK